MNAKTINTEGKTYIVEHGVNVYLFDEYEKRTAEITGVDTYRDSEYRILWVYELSNCHTGKPITVAVINPRLEADEYGFGVEHEGIVWLNDKSSVCDTISDFYSEKLLDIVKAELCELD